jgi:2-polyprenyl-3-methyl-5-hydroxy-6-metoxy-1,4-benzoquinol methylase
MHERYLNREKYFQEQSYTTDKYIVPYINEVLPLSSELSVAEVGCGEGGNLKPFLDIGCKVTGIDLAKDKISNAQKFFDRHPSKNNLTLIAEDIFNIEGNSLLPSDLIMMRDTLEHIHDQGAFLEHLKKFIKPGGMIFIAFPPWRMPFGGHQQMCKSAFLRNLPYFHLLPGKIYPYFLKLFGESEKIVRGLLEIRETGISISGFRKLLNKSEWKIKKETSYLINPNYEIKFGIKPRILPRILNIPFFREFFITTFYCLISPGEPSDNP